MAATTNEMVRVLKTAIEVEENGYTTFKDFAEKTENPDARRMFNRLAQDEIEHKELLQKQLDHLEAGKSIQAVIIPKSAVESLIPQIRDKAKRTKGESGASETDALRTALDLEKKAADFFRQKADETDSQELKDMFIRLAEWEDSHFELIQSELDNIRNTGLWFGIPEFKMDGTY